MCIEAPVRVQFRITVQVQVGVVGYANVRPAERGPVVLVE